ncbi:MAG: phenylacetate--CoA ligase family protein, partial [Actinomadura sp.]
MFVTGVRQMGFAWSMLSGRRFRIADINGLVDDLRATLDTFGAPGAEARDLLTEPDPQLQRDLARRRLRRTVRRAARDVPYYRRWFTEHGVDPDSVTPDSPGAMPPTTKAALRGLPAAFVADGASPALVAQTTGTTGMPTLVWFSRYELDVTAGIGALALMLMEGLRPHHVWANCVSSRSLAPFLGERSITLTGAAFMQLGIVDPRTVLDRLATPLHLPGKERQVTHLNVVPSLLGALVQEVEREGWTARDFGLRRISCGGEVLTDALRRRAEEAFGARVSDGYAMTEIIPVTGAVCSRRHLHIPPDQGHVEVLDRDTHEPAAPGAVGVLTVTPYASYRDTTVLLRYLTGDLVRVLSAGERPDCEMAGIPATSRVLGRMTAEALTTRDVLDLLQAERELPLPTRYALDDAGRGTVLYVVADRISRALLARLEERAADLALPLAGIVLVDDSAELAAACRVRADLREHG